jgi:hypothetical protein
VSTNVYQQKDNGDLKLLAEIEETVEDSEAVELLLENSPRMKVDEFVVIAGNLSDGLVSTVSQKETVTIKWASSRNGGSEEEEVPAPRSTRKRAAAVEEAEEDEAPAPKPRSSKRSQARGSGAAKGTSRGRSRGGTSTKAIRSSSKKSGSSFKRNAASDE